MIFNLPLFTQWLIFLLGCGCYLYLIKYIHRKYMDNHIRCLCLLSLVCSDFINVYVCVSSYLFIHLGNFDSFSLMLSCHRQADIHTFICSTVQCLQMCDQADPGVPHLLSGELAFFQDACHIFLYLFLRAQTLVAMLAGYVISLVWSGLVCSSGGPACSL